MPEEREIWGIGKMWTETKTGAFPGSPRLISYLQMQRHGRWHTSILLQEPMLALDVTKDWKVQRRQKDVSFKRQQLFETTWDRGALINLPLLLATLASVVYCTQGYVLPHCFTWAPVSIQTRAPVSIQQLPLKNLQRLPLTCTLSSKLVPSLKVLFHFCSQYFLNNAHSSPFY